MLKSPSELLLNLKPETRLAFAKVCLDWSIYLIPPILLITWLFQKIGIAILQFISILALTLTLWDVAATSDVRKEQED